MIAQKEKRKMNRFDKIIIFALRFLVKFWLKISYRLREYGTDNIPREGAALLVGNHFTFLDALILYCASKRSIRFVADTNFLPKKSRLANYVIRKTGVIQFVPGDRKTGVQMIRTAQAALQAGELVAIFAEGALTRDGQVRAFKKGYLALLKKTPNAPIIPFGIAGFFGSRFAYAKSKGYKDRPTYRPIVSFGKPFSVAEARSKGWSDDHISLCLLHIVQELCVDAQDYRKHPENVYLLTPARTAIRGCRKYGKDRLLLADSTGKETNGTRTLLEILVLRRVCHRLLGEDKYVGAILPTSVAAVLVNVALGFDRRIPVNLNYTFTNEVLNHCLHRVGIKRVLTSSQLLKKLPKLKIDAELLILEELAKTEIRTSDKVIAFLQSLLPTFILERLLGLTSEKLTDINTVVFTSGSTGMPKGTILTNANVTANCQSFVQSAMPEKDDSLYGTLPFFHSFGYTVTLWFPLMQSHRCVFHYNPLDYKMVGETARKYKPTLFISTPTFMRTYARKCKSDDFASIDFPVAGAEKVSKELYAAWKEKFGRDINEGYGTTELSPVLCHNIPAHRAPDNITPYHIEGSIGYPDPNFVAKVVDMETDEELPPNEPGMLLVKGNSVTPGYFKDPENTAKIFKDGWYVTGDVARIDENNFIYITGRESRISKIGGEMAPHGLIEERLSEGLKAILAEREPATNSTNEEDENYQMVVTAVPDAKKGEKLVVLYVDLPVAPEEICKKVADLELLPPLWIPSTINFHKVEEIPVLGTGKLDLKGVKQKAMQIYNADSEL